MDKLLYMFPERIQKKLMDLPLELRKNIQEIRLRVNFPIEINIGYKYKWLDGLNFNKYDAEYLLNQISQHSLYRLENELKQGFITISGGHRIGITGTTVLEENKIKTIKHISSFNVRIARAKVGIAKPFLSYVYNESFLNTMIVGVPQTGKTTLLRDFAREIGSDNSITRASKVGIVDERSEICGSHNGIAQHSLGDRFDFIDACPKAEGMMILIRSMSPEVIFVDEIGSEKDAIAIEEATHAGVKIFCTVHGKDLSDIRKRPNVKSLIDHKVFERYIIMNNRTESSGISDILQEDGKSIMPSKISIINQRN